MFKRIAETTFALKWPLSLLLVLVTIIMVNATLDLQIDPSTDSLFNKNSQEYKDYRKFSEKFGSDSMIAIAMETPDLFSGSHLEHLKILTDAIGSFPQVERVVSLANVMDIRHKFLGVKVVQPLEPVFNKDKAPEEIRETVVNNELYEGNLISRDGRTATILIYLKSGAKSTESQGAFIYKLKQILAASEEEGVRFYVAGSPVEQYDFIQFIRRDQFLFVPIIILLIIITTYAIYRSFFCVLFAVSIVLMTLVWTMGSIVYMGMELNLVTSLLAPVIMIIAVVNSIHIMNLFFEMRVNHESLKKAVVLTMTELGAPCFLTHFTTILGFVSLAISPVPAIKGFGILAALGTFYSYIVELLVTPILLPILPYPEKRDVPSEHFFNRLLLGFLEKFEFRWKWLILVLTVAIAMISVKGIQRIEVDTSLIKQMKEDMPLAVSTRFIDNNLTGVYVLGFVMNRKDGQPFRDVESLRDMDRLKEFLESQDEIVKVNTVTTLLKKIHMARENSEEAYLIPEEEKKINAYIDGVVASGDDELWKLVTPDFKQIRLEARMKAVGTKEGAAMEERVLQWIEENYSQNYDYNLTGNVVLLGKMAKDLVHQQMRGFGLAFLSILILIVLMFRSIKMGLLAALPNLLPIVMIYGIMGFAKIDLSSPTAMISSIVLGMVVDASIHFLHRFKMEFEKRRHYVQALHHTYRNVGQSLVVSTAILCAGFAASIIASFKPTILLGVLTSLTIFFALICTLMVLPVCLIMLKPFGPERLFKQNIEGVH